LVSWSKLPFNIDTLDRMRGSKGSKVLRTRKIQFNSEYRSMYSYFCSNGCYNEFANKYVEQVIAIAPRQQPLGNTD
jgi:YHS domain-containing protein